MKAPVDLQPTPEYAERKASLSAERRRSLELIEEGIAADPHHRVKRRESEIGTTDYSEQSMFVRFRLLNERTAELIDFVDLTAE